jgi:sodium transport system permease protein
LAWLTLLVLDQFPVLKQLLQEYHPLTGALQSEAGGPTIGYVLVIAVLPALCEELAFRGFILTGLRRRFRPLTAVFLSSFLYALFQMNVFQFATAFVLGAVLALIALRTGSAAPAMVFHLVYNLSALGAAQALGDPLFGASLAIGCSVAAAGLLAAIIWLGKRPVVAFAPEKTGSPTAPAANGTAATDAVQQAPS